jgi:hypothetical protein
MSDVETRIFVFGTREWDVFHLGLETTPLIRACMDPTCSRFSFSFVETFSGRVITNEFSMVFETDSFTPYGDIVLQRVRRACDLASGLPSTPGLLGVSSSFGSAGSSASHSLGHLRVPSNQGKLSFGTRQQSMVAVVKKRKLEVESGANYASPAAVGKAQELAAKQLAAHELVMVLPSECREHLCPGSDLVACDFVTTSLVFAVGKMGAVATLQNCRRQLAALGFWLELNYQRGHAFAMPPGVLLHYLSTLLIGEGDTLHVPAGVKDGLVFAAANLMLDIPVKHPILVAYCRTNHRLAQSAVSTSGAMFLRFYHFATWRVGGKPAYSFAVRYVAICCMVWCIAAIRSIDCQRAKIIGTGPDGVAQRLWLAAACWDSKKKCAFVWLVPLTIFGDSSWVDTLHAGWKKNDFMFCAFDSKRGASLAEMPDDHSIALDKPATPYMVQKWIRELFSMPGCSSPPLMSKEDAALTTRYGNRHLASNVVRCGDASLWPPEVKRRVSYWGSISEMPDRYAQETADLENYKIRVAILDMIWKAVERTPAEQWPAFGGWHLFSETLPSSGRSLVSAGAGVAEEVELLYGDAVAGSDVEDVSDDDDGDAALLAQPSRGRCKEVPAGWAAVSGNRSSGEAYIKHYLHSSSGKKLRSIKEIEAFLAP